MKKVISFSLWGTNPKYTIGAIKNAKLASIIYPGWVCRFYIRKDVPSEIINQLSSFSHCEIILIEEDFSYNNGHDNTSGSFWRFLPASDPEVSIMISRDTDSRLSYREREMVHEFINSEYQFHSIKDCDGHLNDKILGGMWGVKGNLIPDIQDRINKFFTSLSRIQYSSDQRFLDEIYDEFKPHILEHNVLDVETMSKFARLSYEFVGQVYDEFDEPHQHYRNRFKQHLLKNNWV